MAVSFNALRYYNPVSINIKRVAVTGHVPSLRFKPIYGAELFARADAVYFKGDLDAIRSGLQENGTLTDDIVSNSRFSYVTNPVGWNDIALKIIYTALRVKLQKRGFSTIFKDVTMPTGSVLERITTKSILPSQTSNTAFLCHSVTFQLNPREDDFCFLWLD